MVYVILKVKSVDSDGGCTAQVLPGQVQWSPFEPAAAARLS